MSPATPSSALSSASAAVRQRASKSAEPGVPCAPRQSLGARMLLIAESGHLSYDAVAVCGGGVLRGTDI